jgi:pimeloyl-ACP methyl ester carboxylesterase
MNQAASHVSTPAGDLSFLKGGSGPAVVVIHGIGGHKEDWTALVAALAPSHTVYAIDMVGFGTSAKTAPEITIATQMASVIALLNAENIETADLVGNSVGGWVAAMIAASHSSRVGRLVLVDAAGFKAMFEGPPPVNFYPQTVEEMAKLLAFVRHDPQAHTKAFAEMALAAAQASGDAETAERVANGMFISVRLEDLAERIAARTLVIWGAEDRLFPPMIADLVAGHIKGAQKVLIPAASHFPQLDNPSVFNAVVAAFLAS